MFSVWRKLFKVLSSYQLTLNSNFLCPWPRHVVPPILMIILCANTFICFNLKELSKIIESRSLPHSHLYLPRISMSVIVRGVSVIVKDIFGRQTCCNLKTTWKEINDKFLWGNFQCDNKQQTNSDALESLVVRLNKFLIAIKWELSKIS
jgi:hypothetical protein